MREKLYVGMDLGKSFHQVAVVNERKEPIGFPFRVKRGREGVEEMLGQLKVRGARAADVVVTIEATANY